MKKAVLREYLLKRDAEKLGKAFAPVIEKVVESKKLTKPRRVKKGE